MNKFKIGTSLCCCAALFGIVGGVAVKTKGFQQWNFTSKEISQNDIKDDIQSQEVVENMTVAMMAKTENNDGTTSYKYSYALGPSDATRLHMTGALSFVEANLQGENINNYLSFTVNESEKTFTITKKADFSHQAKFVLTCDANPSVNAVITLDCKQYFTGYNDFSEKTYRQLVTEDDSVIGAEILADMESEAGVNNLSEAYTIALENPYRLEHIEQVATHYLTGNDINNMSTSITLNKNYQIYKADLKTELDLATFVEKVYADQEHKFTNQQARIFTNNSLFGVAYDLKYTFNVDGEIKVCTAHVIAVADSSEFSFGLPKTLELESSAMTFENYSSSFQLVRNDSNVETLVNFNKDPNSGWYYIDAVWNNSYVNIEVTRYLDGVQVSQNRLYGDNTGKGLNTGNSADTRYLVYNPGSAPDYEWTDVYKKLDENLYLINSFIHN